MRIFFDHTSRGDGFRRKGDKGQKKTGSRRAGAVDFFFFGGPDPGERFIPGGGFLDILTLNVDGA